MHGPKNKINVSKFVGDPLLWIQQK